MTVTTGPIFTMPVFPLLILGMRLGYDLGLSVMVRVLSVSARWNMMLKCNRIRNMCVGSGSINGMSVGTASIGQ